MTDPNAVPDAITRLHASLDQLEAGVTANLNPRYEYRWHDSDDHVLLSQAGAKGWRVVPGIYDPSDATVLMERRAK